MTENIGSHGSMKSFIWHIQKLQITRHGSYVQHYIVMQKMCLQYAEELQVFSYETSSLQHVLAEYLIDQGIFEEAETYLTKLLDHIN